MTFAQGFRAALLALLIALPAGAARAQPAILVLDASESMWGEVEARTKIATAQDALAGLMARWPDQRPVGLLAYGHRRAGDCTDVEMLAAPAPDAAALVAAAARVTPRGRTPIAEALRQAADALGPGGGSVILVADGIETCHPDPCAVAQEAARTAPRLVVHSIAFALSDPAALAQLRCMAEATGGRAMAAQDGAELADALDRAAAAPLPGPRAAAPRAEPVPQPRLVVIPRLCRACDPVTGGVRIELRRGEEVVATDGEPFGRFLELAAGDYAVMVVAPLLLRGPFPVRVPAAGAARLDLPLDAAWLVVQTPAEPPGLPLPDGVAVEWRGGPDAAPHAVAAGPLLVPAGAQLLRARLGNATGEAATRLAAGEVARLSAPLRFGLLSLRLEGFSAAPAQVAIARAEGDAPPIEVPAGADAGIPLAPGRYRILGGAEGGRAVAEVEIEAGRVTSLTLHAGMSDTETMPLRNAP